MTDPLTPLEVMRAALEHGTPRAPNSILHRIEQMGYTIVPSAARADTAALVVEAMEREGVVTWGDNGHRARFLAALEAADD